MDVYGGFQGTESSLSQRSTFPRAEPDPFASVLDGNWQGTVVTCPVGVTSRLDGFTVTNGYAGGGKGGGIYCSSDSVTIANCRIVGNYAYYDGGSVHCYYSSPTLTGCTISGNGAEQSGGRLYLSNSSSTLTLCSITGNKALLPGGGLVAYASGGSYTVTLANCIISGNVSSSGSGIYCAGDGSGEIEVVASSCTLTHNSGGACIHLEGPNSGAEVVNSIIAYNTAGLNNEGDGFSPFSYNCVWGNTLYNYLGMDDPTGSEGNISVDPQVVAGHLLPGSPCIDAGDSTAVTTTEDIDSGTRILGANVDIGADEFGDTIIQGTLYPQDYGGNMSGWVVPAELRLSTGGVVLRRLWLDPAGGFVVASVSPDVRWISLHPPRFLRRTVSADASGGSVLGVDVELTNGDIDGDNEVTLFDFGRLVSAFGSMPGDDNWNPYADLDGDEEVTLFDFGILVSSFGAIGDD